MNDELERLLKEAKDQKPPQRKRGRKKVYENHPSMQACKCHYCGVPTTGEDHYPPRSCRHIFPNVRALVIRCCNECNSRLSNSMQPSVEERAKVCRLLIETNKYLAKTDEEGFWKNIALSSFVNTDKY